MSIICKCFLIYLFTYLVIIIPYIQSATPASLDKTFEKGVKAYSEERWSKCIEKFEEAIHIYKLYKSIVINCRLKCNTQQFISNVKDDIDDLPIFEKYFNKRNCLNQCLNQEFNKINIERVPDNSVLRDMQARKPYEYLHICYFQMRMFHKAASAAYTYLMANLEDETMKNNVHYYLQQPEVDDNEVIDLESAEYTVLYTLGRKSFNKQNWAETVASMEEALKEYFISENNCRVECEQQSEQDFSPDFIFTMSNNIASLLNCRQKCQQELKVLNYNSGVEFLADVLNYLQYSYYQLEKYNAAAKAVASYLELMPNDPDIKENEKYYSELVEKSAFDPITDVVHYLKRDTYEKELLSMFRTGNENDFNSNAI